MTPPHIASANALSMWTIAVTVKNICNRLDLLTGTASAVATDNTSLNADGTLDVTFGYGALPSGETFPISGYDYLAMNYLLVGKDSATHDVSFQVNGISASKEYTEVPLKANYRTNLYGTLLTSKSTFDIDIEIDPTFEDYIITYKNENFDNLQDAIAALDRDGTVEENTIKIWKGDHYVTTNDDLPRKVTFEGMNDNVSVSLRHGDFYSWSYRKIIFKNLNMICKSFDALNARIRLGSYTTLEFIGCKIDGELTISHFDSSKDDSTNSCTFKNCDFTSDSESWGCLSLKNITSADITNCNFNNFFRISSNAAMVYSFTATIDNCYFSNENAFSNTAAINYGYTKAGTVIINNTTASGFDYGLCKDNSEAGYQGTSTVTIDGVTQ